MDPENNQPVDEVIEDTVIEDAQHEDTDLEAQSAPNTETAQKPDATAELVALLKEQALEKKKAQETATAPKTLSPEELEAKWGRVQVTPDDLAAIGFLEASPEQVKGLQTLLDKVVNYALNKSGHSFEDRFSKAEATFNPVLQAYQQQQQEAQRNSFYTKYPHLKGKEELVGLVAQSLKSNPEVASLPTDKLFEHLNTTTLAMLKKHGITSSAQPSPQKAAPKPNSLSSAGGSTETKPKQEGTTNPQQAAALRILRNS